jgi:hypothetical protein
MSQPYGEDGQLPSTRGFGVNVKLISKRTIMKKIKLILLSLSIVSLFLHVEMKTLEITIIKMKMVFMYQIINL